MNQTISWALRRIIVLGRHIEEQKNTLADDQQAIALLQQQHRHEWETMHEFLEADLLVALLIQQVEERQALMNRQTQNRQAMYQRQQQEEQRLLHTIEQEQIRQN